MPRSANAQEILEEVGDVKAIARDLREFRKTAKILSSSTPRLIDIYPDRWIAVYDGKVQFSGKTLKSVLNGAKKLNLPKERYLIRYIAKKRKTMIFAGLC